MIILHAGDEVDVKKVKLGTSSDIAEIPLPQVMLLGGTILKEVMPTLDMLEPCTGTPPNSETIPCGVMNQVHPNHWLRRMDILTPR